VHKFSSIVFPLLKVALSEKVSLVTAIVASTPSLSLSSSSSLAFKAILPCDSCEHVITPKFRGCGIDPQEQEGKANIPYN
jgi:hypothetical protein